ncbi:MAG: hypothetical protein RIB80_04845 [Rhodospirillales bacterium]
MHVSIDECEAAGLDPDVVERIAKRLSKAALEADELGLTIFGGTGDGSLRFRERGSDHCLIVASLNGTFDGGDGGTAPDENGLLRGE